MALLAVKAMALAEQWAGQWLASLRQAKQKYRFLLRHSGEAYRSPPIRSRYSLALAQEKDARATRDVDSREMALIPGGESVVAQNQVLIRFHQLTRIAG
jgi:hypothetical protein